MPELAAKEQFEYSIATAPATLWQRRLAFVIVVVTLGAFGANIPFANTPLARIDSFIPTMMAVIFVTDLVTAVLLFGQFSTTRSRALLLLASGYFFSSLMVISHALTYPDAFAPTGLLGAGSQTTAYINCLWRFGLSVALLGYALLAFSNHTKIASESSPQAAITWTVTIVIVVVCTLTWVTTAGNSLLPILIDGTVSPLGHIINGTIALTDMLALLLLWTRGRSVLDLWLMVALCALMGEAVLVTFFVTARFTFGFYAIRLISLVVSKVVLIALLSETVILNERLVSAFMLQRRERENRLMSVEAATAALAHEIKQPLAAISVRCSTALRWLKRTPPEYEEVTASLTGVIEASHRANEVVDSTRELFKATAHQMTPVEINRLVRQVLRMLENDLRVQGVTVSTEFQDDLPQITGDRTLLQQVILNLVKNAIEAMGTVPTTIKALRLVTTQDDNSVVSLSIQDTGPGINPENGTHVFDAFFTTKSSGMGLGLSISQKIIRDHGGDLRLTKTSSNGCTFEITLPSAATNGSGGLRRTIAAAGAGV